MASKGFNKIHSAIWRSARFQALDSDGRLLMLYFMTSEHQTSAGAYRIPDGYAAADLGWPAEHYRDIRAALIDVALISHDPEHETIYVENWFKLNPPMNEKHALGTRRLLEMLDSPSISAKAVADFEQAYTVKATANVSPALRDSLRGHLQPVPGGRR